MSFLINNPFDLILNCSSSIDIHPKFYKTSIDILCKPVSSILDLFENRFCIALSHALITLNNFKNDSNNEDINNINVNSEPSSQDSQNSVFGFDFVNHDHPSHISLRLLLEKHNISTIYNKYCKYLNRLVLHVLIYQDQIEDFPSYKTHASTFQTLFDIDTSSIFQFSYEEPTCSRENLLTFLKFSLLKIQIPFELFEEVISYQIQNKNDSHSKDQDIQNLKDFKLLVEYSSDLNVQCVLHPNFYCSVTPLMYASFYGKVEYVAVLLEYGANVDEQSDSTLTALHYAAQGGNVPCLQLLIDIGGANVNKLDLNNMTPLMHAAQYDQVDCLKYLIDGDSNVNVNLYDNDEFTALFYTSNKRKSDGLMCLLENGAEVDKKNQLGESTLIYTQNVNTIKILIAYGADVNIKTYYGMTCFMKALDVRDFTCVEALLELGNSISLFNSIKHIEMLLKYLFYLGKQSQIPKLVLEEYKVNLDFQDSVGKTVLMSAIVEGNVNIVGILIECNVQLNLCDNNGKSPLIYAAIEGHSEILKLLIDHGANIDTQDNTGKTALMYAVGMDNHNCINILVQNKSCIDIKDKQGMTALMYAIENGNQESIKILKSNNSDDPDLT